MFYIISCDKYVCEKSVHEKKSTFLRVFLKGDKYVCVLYIKLIPNEFVTDRWGIRSAAVKNSVEFFTPRDKSDRIFHTCEESAPWEIRFNKAFHGKIMPIKIVMSGRSGVVRGLPYDLPFFKVIRYLNSSSILPLCMFLVMLI